MSGTDPVPETRLISARPFRDGWFWIALSLGPLCWLGLWLLQGRPSLAPKIQDPVTWGMLVVIYPVLEEIVFRGGLQGWLLDRPKFDRQCCGLTLANLLTSLVFTALHFLNHPPLWAALVLFPSLVFGWSRDRHASLSGAIVLHVFYNFGMLTLF